MLHAALATITGSYHPVDCTRLRLQFIGHTKTTRKRASHGLDIESACITSIICLANKVYVHAVHVPPPHRADAIVH